MEKGKLLGSGVTAEVYEWGKDKVLKLYFNKYSNDDWVDHEAKVGYLVHESGIASPAVFDKVEIDGRHGIILQRIFGRSITEHLITEPWELYNYMKQLAVLQHNIHKISTNGLPSQKEKFTYKIRASSYILRGRLKKIIDYMESLPDGECTCHGDLHFNNIIVSGEKLVPIDWNGAYKGNPLGDVARTCMIIHPPTLFEIPDAVSMLTYYPRLLAYQVYINEYMRLAKVKYEDIDVWMLPVAAARLKDRIPGEKRWLLDIIDKRLEQLR